MSRNKIRKYPPIAVTLVVTVALVLGAATAIAREATATPKEAAETERQSVILTEPPEEQRPTAPEIVADAALHTTSPGREETITSEPEETAQPYQSMIHSRDWDGEDSEMLMKIAMAEAEGESVEGKALVMLVVLNRVWSDAFPDTIEEVIFQPRQFTPAVPGGRYYTTEPDDGCREALALVLDGWDESEGALYFESGGKDGWHSQSLEFLFEYGGHKFYR